MLVSVRGGAARRAGRLDACAWGVCAYPAICIPRFPAPQRCVAPLPPHPPCQCLESCWCPTTRARSRLAAGREAEEQGPACERACGGSRGRELSCWEPSRRSDWHARRLHCRATHVSACPAQAGAYRGGPERVLIRVHYVGVAQVGRQHRLKNAALACGGGQKQERTSARGWRAARGRGAAHRRGRCDSCAALLAACSSHRITVRPAQPDRQPRPSCRQPCRLSRQAHPGPGRRPRDGTSPAARSSR